MLGAFGFTGELQDGETNLVYLRARWYDPGSGTLTTRDPFAGFPETPYSLHPYQYAYSNPVVWTDARGLCVPGTPGCPKRENPVDTGRQWCMNGVDQTPTDGIDDCAIAQDTTDFWETFWQRVGSNDAQYDRLLRQSTPRAPKISENPLCKINGMEYLCDVLCLEPASTACCGPQVDDWFARDIQAHWSWVQGARIAAPAVGAVGLGTIAAVIGGLRGGPAGAGIGGVVGGAAGTLMGWLGGFALYARGIPHKAYDFPLIDSCGAGTCQGTVTLCRRCLDRSELGNMMYGMMAREWGIPYALTLAAAWQFGGMDTTADEAAIAIGYRAVRIRPPNGQRLCAQIWQWPRTWTHHASDPWTTGGCKPCAAVLPAGTPHTRPAFGDQLP
ncbi:MAG: RHS repeat-associated core domain-containing protein [Chloroflexales bacterium]|nr:RHS repeat-associated core domain-containing protein [Chloroflexales bacterium]